MLKVLYLHIINIWLFKDSITEPLPWSNKCLFFPLRLIVQVFLYITFLGETFFFYLGLNYIRELKHVHVALP